MDCRYLLLPCDLPFYSLKSMLWGTEVLNFIEVQCSNIFTVSAFLWPEKSLLTLRSWRYSTLFSSRSFIVFCLDLRLPGVDFNMWWEVGVAVHFLLYKCSVAPVPVIGKTTLSPHLVVSFYHKWIDRLCLTLFQDALFCFVGRFVCPWLLPHCLIYCCFIINLDTWWCNFSSFGFLLECLSFSSCVYFYIHFGISLLIFILIRIAENL